VSDRFLDSLVTNLHFDRPIRFLAEAGWHHPGLILTYPRLTVRLQTHDASGVTDKDFELARRIEGIVTWLPAEGDALDGPPKRWVK
jgi:4a-hydroxytetrahydrobiopterin dehydratase